MFKKNKRGFLQISFAWLFAIIVGAVILAFAIFAVTKLIGTQDTVVGAKTAKQIGVLLNPLETSFESAQTTILSFPAETRIYNKCNSQSEPFGKQIIQISQKSFDKWTPTDIDISFENKYIFSGDYAEGQNFYIFSKPLDFPFKVADLIYLTSSQDNYCFVDAPDDIKDELTTLGQKNIFIDECDNLENEIKVCFNQDLCDINVNYNNEYVKKRDETMYFKTDTLMYAAIFSNADIYDCQLQRIMDRIIQLNQLYMDKENFISQRGCNSNLRNDLIALSNQAKILKVSDNLGPVWNIAQSVGNKNKLNSQWKLW